MRNNGIFSAQDVPFASFETMVECSVRAFNLILRLAATAFGAGAVSVQAVKLPGFPILISRHAVGSVMYQFGFSAPSVKEALAKGETL